MGAAIGGGAIAGLRRHRVGLLALQRTTPSMRCRDRGCHLRSLAALMHLAKTDLRLEAVTAAWLPETHRASYKGKCEWLV